LCTQPQGTIADVDYQAGALAAGFTILMLIVGSVCFEMGSLALQNV